MEAAELFDAWANSTLICPEFDEIGKINIEGDTASIDSKNLIFKIEMNKRSFRSNDPLKKTSQAELDAFLADFEVSTWAVNSRIDFTSREKIPIRKQ
jgi:hypothetical protein